MVSTWMIAEAAAVPTRGGWRWAGRVGGRWEAGGRWAASGQEAGGMWAASGQEAGGRQAASRQEVGSKWVGQEAGSTGSGQEAGRAGGRKWAGSGQEGLVFYEVEKDLGEELMLVLGIHSFEPNHTTITYWEFQNIY